MRSDDYQFPDTERRRDQVQESRVLGHLTVRTRETRPDDPMFGRVFIVSLPDLPLASGADEDGGHSEPGGEPNTMTP